MNKDLWLPNGYKLPDESKIRALLHSGGEWQVFDTTGPDNILLASPDLTQKWNDCGFLDKSLFENISFGNESFKSLSSHKKYTLTAVEDGKSLESKTDALAFALALKESRKLSETASFHDAIYVEQYSRLLPTWTLTPHVDDEVVLGTRITGGVVISTESFRRLTNLTGWMSTDDLTEIINAAGFSVPADASLLVKHKPASQPKTRSKTTSAKETIKPDQQRESEKPARAKTFRLPGRPQLEEFFRGCP